MTLGKCPICGRPEAAEDLPFCARRCADVDLNRWLTNRYAVPAGDDDEDPPEAPGED